MSSASKNLTRFILITTLLIFAATAVAQSTQTARSAKKGAGWGALAGLVFGGSLWDVAGGAMVGAAGGAAFGSDNVDGLFALRDCQHEKAYLHAMAGANSDMLSHRLASTWLEAMISLDKKDSKTAHRAYQQIVVQDDTVANVEQAKTETTDAVVDVRADRKNMGIQCKA